MRNFVTLLLLAGVVVAGAILGYPESTQPAPPREPSEPHVVLTPLHPNGKLVIYFHGAGGTKDTVNNDILSPGYLKQTADALVGSGYTVAASEAQVNNWGNRAGQQDYLDLYNWVKAKYNLKQTYFWSISMGGMSSILLTRKIPVSAYVGMEPAFNLANMRTTYLAPQIAASGATDDPVAHHDYPKIPYLFFASYQDTTVARTQNSDLIDVKKQIIPTHGPHSDPSNTDHAAEVVGFFNAH